MAWCKPQLTDCETLVRRDCQGFQNFKERLESGTQVLNIGPLGFRLSLSLFLPLSLSLARSKLGRGRGFSSGLFREV